LRARGGTAKALVMTAAAPAEPGRLIYKICSQAAWQEAERAGFFLGSPVDLADGYIHFSLAEQVQETATRHFRGQADLVLVAIAADNLGDALRYEPSRGGALFPHLYGPLPVAAARSVVPLPLGADGVPTVPELPA
jgi:uncharacterized protein (DUF952 family)